MADNSTARQEVVLHDRLEIERAGKVASCERMWWQNEGLRSLVGTSVAVGSQGGDTREARGRTNETRPRS
jgi:hypothetical protein